MTSKQILIIVLATLFTVVIWVVTDILHSRQEVKIPPEVAKLTEPITTSIDQEAINSL